MEREYTIEQIVEATISECYPEFKIVTSLPDNYEKQILNKVKKRLKEVNY